MRTSIKFKLFILLILYSSNSVFALNQPISPENVQEYCLQTIQEFQTQQSQVDYAHYLRGYFYFRSLKHKEALDSFLLTDKAQPNNSAVTQMIAFLFAQLNQHDQAVEWYQKTVRLNPKADKANQRLGDSLAKLGKHEEAVNAYQKEIEYYPANAFAQFGLANSLFELEKNEEAKHYLKQASENNSVLPEPYYLLSKILRKEGKNEEAAAALKIFQQKKKEEEKLVDAATNPVDDRKRASDIASTMHFEIGLYYLQNQKNIEAETHLRRAVEINSQNQEACFELAKLYQEQMKLDQATALGLELVQLNSQDVRYPTFLGLTLASQKKWVEAENYLGLALSLEPNNPEIQKSLAKVLISSQRDPKRAVNLLSNVVSLDATAENYDLLSRAYYTMGEITPSMEAMRMAMNLEPNNPIYRQRYEKLLSQTK